MGTEENLIKYIDTELKAIFHESKLTLEKRGNLWIIDIRIYALFNDDAVKIKHVFESIAELVDVKYEPNYKGWKVFVEAF